VSEGKPGGQPPGFSLVNTHRAIRDPKWLADKHADVIVWSREANPDIGEYGPPTTLFVSGDAPDME
jgi:hypothetical protein